MNWFERYGIPGLYFVLLIAAACYIFGPPCDKDTAIEIFAAALSASVPIGYVLVIFSQMLVYCNKIRWWRVHHKAWENAKNDEDRHEDKEWWVEAHATILGRWRYFDKDNKLEAAKWLQEWFTKRFDVLAINSALILATVFGLLVLIIMWCSRFSQSPPPELDCYRKWALGAFIVVSILAIVILVLNNNFLTKQARHVAAEYYKDLRKQEAKIQTSSSSDQVS